ncbi:MAG: hypothetical protein JST92_14855 [Deltaproteobacteria bacterium]|nr:hypothetical protein [Deltaproteobacteria bacterium]
MKPLRSRALARCTAGLAGAMLAALSACGQSAPGVPPDAGAQATAVAAVIQGATLVTPLPGQPAQIKVLGTASAGATVRIHADTCQGTLLGAGPVAEFTSAGISIAAPARQDSLTLVAESVAAGAPVSCSAAFQMVLPAERPAADSWKQAGFGSLADARAAWSKVAAAQAAFRKFLPAFAVEALQRARRAPIAQLSSFPKQPLALVTGDYDCDGKADVALITLPLASRLGAALASDAPPEDALLGPLLVELRRIALDGGSELFVVTANPRSAPLVRSANGLFHSGKPAAMVCKQTPEDAALLKDAGLGKCDVLEFLVGESASSGFVVWDHARKVLVTIEGC